MKSILPLIWSTLLLSGIVWAEERTSRGVTRFAVPPNLESPAHPFSEVISKDLRGSDFVNRTYRVQPGDVLNVHFWGEHNEAYNVVVSADGEIYLPILGELAVGGMSLLDVEAMIKSETAKYYRNVRSGISLMTHTPTGR